MQIALAKTAKQQQEEIDAIRETMASLIAEGRSAEAIDAALSMLVQMRHLNTELMLRIAALQRERSGRRSEKIDPAQLSLLLQLCEEAAPDSLEEEPVDDDPQDGEVIDESEKVRRRPRRRRPSKELPRDVIHHELPAEERKCSGCGEEMRHIGDDTSEILELVPAQFRVQEHHRPKYACPRCKETVKTAPGPAKLIDKGLPGPALLAHVVQSKYEDAIPLQRLRKIYHRAGVDLSVSTLCDWVEAVAEEVRPLVERTEAKMLGSHVVQTDGTGLKVLDRDDPEHIRRGTMWCSVGDRKHVVFRFAPSGSGEDGPWKFLAGRTGYLQADASNVFDRLFNGEVAQAIEVGCMVHARRKFYALVDSDPRVAYPLELIGKLYRVEDFADRRGLSPEERQQLRQERSTGILERLQRWITKTAAREPPESALHKACAYSINHWEALTRFLQDGLLALDNNLCELQIRSLAVGRKSFLFAGSDAGAERAAILYSLLRTCALQGVDCYAYLVDVLEKLAAGWPASRIDELLPETWAARRAAPMPEPVLA
jgi:transposase